MASARFYEITRCTGVDQNIPGMVVPLGGENQVLLETHGMDLKVEPANGAIRLGTFDGRDIARMLRDRHNELMQPGVDPQIREALLPATGAQYWDKPWFYRVHGTTQTGFPGTLVKATPRSVPGRGTPSAVAPLQVAVVDRMVIKMAIRNVRARDQQGNMRLHAKQPCNPVKEVATMNAIWTPQTNIVFELVPSTDVVVDHDDPTTQEDLRRAHGLKPDFRPTFHAESTIWAEKDREWFAKHRVPGTDMTFFLVHKIHGGGTPDYGRGGYPRQGTMNPQTGVSFISGAIRLPSTVAHEAGHFLGNMPEHKGTDISLLMREGGAGYKIPFDLVGRFRQFRRPVH